MRTTTTLITGLAILILATGCQSVTRTGAATPARVDAHLDARLAAIEQARLVPVPSGRGNGLMPGCDAEPRPLVRANRPAARFAQISADDTDEWADAGASYASPQMWALVDMGDEAFTKDTDLQFASGQSGDRHARRPPLDSFWETLKRDVKDMPSDVWRDTKRVYANPVNLVILGSAYGGSLVLQQTGVDGSIEDHFRGSHDHFGDDWNKAFDAMGNPGTHFGLAGLWYIVGQQTGDEKTYEVGKTLFSALMINGLTTMAGKAATWDRGPNGGWGTLPSGHTSSSFCMASVLHEAYGHAVGIPLYGLAALVAAERIDDDEHYFSDVVMGAVLGTLVGHSVASGRDPEFFGWKVLPYANPNGATGIAFMKTMP